MQLRAPKPNQVAHWYGWQTLIVDSASIVLAALAFAIDSEAGASALAVAAVATYAFGAPIVHNAHDNPGRAGLSLGLRIVLPLLVGGLTLAGEECSDFCGASGIVPGAALAIAPAIIIDATALAWETVTEPTTVQPVAAINRDHLLLGLRGTL